MSLTVQVQHIICLSTLLQMPFSLTVFSAAGFVLLRNSGKNYKGIIGCCCSDGIDLFTLASLQLHPY